MVGLMMLSAVGWAEEHPKVTELRSAYPTLNIEEIATSLMLAPQGVAVVPDGVAVRWPQSNGYVAVEVKNETDDTIEIDWNQTAFIYPDRYSVGVAPLSAPLGSAKGSLPNAIVPVDAAVFDVLLREDSLHNRQDLFTLVRLEDVDERVSVSMGMLVDGELVRVVEEFEVSLNTVRLERAMEVRALIAEKSVQAYKMDWIIGVPGFLFKKKHEEFFLLGEELKSLHQELAGLLDKAPPKG
jgi:hypothetical protein